MTVNSQVLVLPQMSFAVQVTTVWPWGKNDPDGGTQVTGRDPSQLSTALTEYVTSVPAVPGINLAEISVQPLWTGGVTS